MQEMSPTKDAYFSCLFIDLAAKSSSFFCLTPAQDKDGYILAVKSNKKGSLMHPESININTSLHHVNELETRDVHPPKVGVFTPCPSWLYLESTCRSSTIHIACIVVAPNRPSTPQTIFRCTQPVPRVKMPNAC